MTADSSQLLSRLLGPIRPAGSSSDLFGAPASPHRPIEAQSFEGLLASAQRGELRSERTMTASPALSAPPNAEQLDRLALAADRAEAAGARRAVMAMDGRLLIVDLPARRVVAELSPASSDTIVPVDAAMSLSQESAAAAMGLRSFPGLSALLPANLTHRSGHSPLQGA